MLAGKDSSALMVASTLVALESLKYSTPSIAATNSRRCSTALNCATTSRIFAGGQPASTAAATAASTFSRLWLPFRGTSLVDMISCSCTSCRQRILPPHTKAPFSMIASGLRLNHTTWALVFAANERQMASSALSTAKSFSVWFSNILALAAV